MKKLECVGTFVHTCTGMAYVHTLMEHLGQPVADCLAWYRWDTQMHTHTCTVPPKATVAHQNVMADRYTVVHIPTKFSRSSSH